VRLCVIGPKAIFDSRRQQCYRVYAQTSLGTLIPVDPVPVQTRFTEGRYSGESVVAMPFDLPSWRERFEQARSERNAPLVRDLLDEVATAYRRMSKEKFSAIFARFVTE
jgi:hypothetical protein